jgi:hypothetical protein
LGATEQAGTDRVEAIKGLGRGDLEHGREPIERPAAVAFVNSFFDDGSAEVAIPLSSLTWGNRL